MKKHTVLAFDIHLILDQNTGCDTARRPLLPIFDIYFDTLNMRDMHILKQITKKEINDAQEIY